MTSSEMELLSKKPLCKFTPEEYKSYVRSLFFKRAPKKAKKKPLAPWKWRKNAKGTLIIKFNRDWISEAELQQISSESAVPLNEVWIKVFHPKAKRKVKIRLSTPEDEKKIDEALAQFPW